MKKITTLIIAVLLSSIAFSQSNAEANFKKAWGLMEAEKYTEAIEYFTKSIDEIEMGSSYVNRGICKLELRDTIGAIEDYKEAIRLNPDDKYASYNSTINIGFLSYEQANYDVAIEYYNKAIGIDKNNYIAYSYLGDIYYYKEDYEKTIEFYSKAINLEKKSYDLYIKRAEVYLDIDNEEAATEDNNKAIKLCDKEIEKFGSSAELYYYRGFAKHGNDDIKAAIQDYTRAIQKDSDYADAYYLRGYAYIDLEKIEEACLDFKKAKELGINTDEELMEYCK